MNTLKIELPELPYAVEEAMNRLRINIKFCGKNTRKILITSSLPNEGKSTVSVQLWRMLAEAGFPCVFVDVDLRKSVLKKRHEMTCPTEEKDLGNYLSGFVEYQDIIYNTNIENGYYVPCFTNLENPSLLLEDGRFKELLEQLAKEYRYVIIDSPPLINVADGALVASMCDGAVLVVRAGETSKKLVKESMQHLKRVKCRLLGAVLNGVETSNSPYYRKYYGKYYEYGYGTSESDK